MRKSSSCPMGPLLIECTAWDKFDQNLSLVKVFSLESCPSGSQLGTGALAAAPASASSLFSSPCAPQSEVLGEKGGGLLHWSLRLASHGCVLQKSRTLRILKSGKEGRSYRCCGCGCSGAGSRAGRCA